MDLNTTKSESIEVRKRGSFTSLLRKKGFIEQCFTVLCLVVTAGFAVSAYHNILSNQARERAQSGTELSLRADLFIRPSSLVYGSPSASYKLVEFSDYECPPCRGTEPLVVQVARTYGSRLAVYHRNLPLVNIHPMAMPAALASATAELNGKLAAIHPILMTGTLDEPSISQAETQVGEASADLAKRRKDAEALVRADVSLAGMSGVTGTPGFVLITPRGTAIRLRGATDIDTFIDR
jgi:protein-disulfide isomerase